MQLCAVHTLTEICQAQTDVAEPADNTCTVTQEHTFSTNTDTLTTMQLPLEITHIKRGGLARTHSLGLIFLFFPTSMQIYT